MQIMIDTNADNKAELYRIGKWLVSQYEVIDAEPQETSGPITLFSESDAPASVTTIPAPPPVPLTVEDVISDNDVEVEIDDEGNISALTTSVELPQAPPPPPAPPAPAPVPTPPGAAPEFDKRGMPWDGRIHAANRAKKIDGNWKNKRGVPDETIAAVEAQNGPLAQSPADTATIPAGSTGIVPSAPAPAPPVAPPAPIAPPAPPPPPPTGGNAAPPAAAPSGPIDFRGLMQKIQAATAVGKLSTAQVNAALASVGLKPEEMGVLINNAPLIASVNAAISACLAS